MFELHKLIEEGISESDFETTRAFLSKSVSLLMDGQSRQLGYAFDSQYYEIENFADYVRDSLTKLTLADVNRVIRENLQTDDMQFVFVAKDATDLRQRLISDQVSPMTYDANMSQELLDEDATISRSALGFAKDKVTIVNAERVFQ
jgi:zinc protease